MPEDPIGQDEIEKLLAEAQKASGQSPSSPEADDPAATKPAATKPDSAKPDSAKPDLAEPPAASASQAKVTLDQSELDAMLGKTGPRAPEPPSPPPATPPAGDNSSSAEPSVVTQNDIELLLNQAEDAIASIDSPSQLPPGIAPFQLDDFGGTPANTESATLELVRDVELDMKIELGRTHMHLEDVLRLSQGAVVALDKLAGDPVDLFVNGRKIARGEVLVLNDNFCVRITELIVGDNACA